MMKVAICDRDKKILELLEKTVLANRGGVKRCDRYEDLQSLLKAVSFRAGGYQLVILDIEWDGENQGIEAGRRICEMNPETRILWMARQPERYIQQLFLEPVNLLGLLVKPVDPGFLEQYIHKALQDNPAPVVRHLLIRNRGVVTRVGFDEIIYLESSGHVVAVQTRENHYLCYGRLEKFLEQLPEYFIQCHKSYIVNMKEISRLEKGGILMDQGMVVPVSKSRYSGTKKRYVQFMEQVSE